MDLGARRRGEISPSGLTSRFFAVAEFVGLMRAAKVASSSGPYPARRYLSSYRAAARNPQQDTLSYASSLKGLRM
jgi:hypothetical protein